MDDIKFYIPADEAGEWRELPGIPARAVLHLPKVRTQGRLRSTRGGANFNWIAGRIPLSGSQFEPRIDLLWEEAPIIFLGWHSPSEEPSLEEMFWLSQGGTAVRCPFLVYSAHPPKDLSHRGDRQALLYKVRDYLVEEILGQGHLTAQPLSIGEEQFLEIAESLGIVAGSPNRPVSLANHFLFVNRVIGLDFTRFVSLRETTAVVSPDHFCEPLFLEAGVWLLSHPIPSRDGGD